MNFSLVLVAIAGAFIAYINGANDVSKGIAPTFAAALATRTTMPMSTTHVSTGSIMGIGLHRKMNWRTVRKMALAWVVTLPVAALLGALFYTALRFIHA